MPDSSASPGRAPAGPTGSAERFDRRYYRHYYGTGGVHDRARVGHLAAGVHELAAWWGVRVRSVLDVGAGVGMWRDWYRDHHPAVRIRSIDVSEYACATWGHERRDIADWRPPGRFDLVVCHSVLQYLDNARVERAIEHLCGATRHLLYLELPTRSDLDHMVDPTHTDLEVHRRSGAWYRKRFQPHLQQVGAGLWIHRDSTPMFELEAAGR